MRFSIKWHQQALESMKRTLLQEEETVKNHQMNANRLKAEIKFYGEQIDAAIKQGKEGFDEERFLKPTKPAVV